MSQENVEVFKCGADALNSRDLNALLAVIHPDIEWHPGLSALLGGEATVYRGHEGVRSWFRGIEEAFSETTGEFSEIKDLGDRVVAIGHLHARGRESGVETDAPFAYVIDFEDDKLIRVRTYLDHAQALEAAGLTG